jgi:hypothetical protein
VNTDKTVFDSICPNNQKCTRQQDVEFVANYNSIFRDILRFFGFNDGVLTQTPTPFVARIFGLESFVKNQVPMKDYIAAQYCMTCVD